MRCRDAHCIRTHCEMLSHTQWGNVLRKRWANRASPKSNRPAVAHRKSRSQAFPLVSNHWIMFYRQGGEIHDACSIEDFWKTLPGTPCGRSQCQVVRPNADLLPDRQDLEIRTGTRDGQRPYIIQKGFVSAPSACW